MSRNITVGQLTSIAWADASESTAALAERLGAKYVTVHVARARLARDGFTCRLYWITCDHCGRPYAAYHLRQRLHPRCRSAHHLQFVARRQQAHPDQVATYHAASNRRNAERRRAETPGVPVMQPRRTPAEDARILTAARGELAAIAEGLGRSRQGVVLRRHRLRQHAKATDPKRSPGGE